MIPIRTAGLLLLILTPSVTAKTRHDRIFPIADFNQQIRNRLGGTSNRFQRSPSSAAIYLTPKVFHGKEGKSLNIIGKRADTGFCGFYMHLCRFQCGIGPEELFDSRKYTHLSFWVKGEEGGETFTVRLSDELLLKKEDSAEVGPIEQFLPDGVTTDWQRVLVPLDLTWRLDRKKMTGVTIEFHRPGDYEIFVDDVSVVAIPEPKIRAAIVRPVPKPSHPRAMWVWHTPELIRLDARGRADFFNFCQREGIEHLWMQLLYVFETPVDLGPPSPRNPIPDETICAIRAQDNLRRFHREAHRAGLKVYGLDGYPEFVQKEYHHCPLSIVDAVIAFNEASAPDERYDGVHFDNEPHLLVGWANWDRRKQILQEFLDLLAQCQQRIRSQPGLQFGVDIPFWWQHADERTGKIQGEALFNGVLKAASYHCIDIVDSVGIMNYRDVADGPDGMVAHGSGLLAYGDKANRAKIYMGIETIAEMDIEVWFAVGLPHAEFDRAMQTRAKDFSYLSRLDEFRLRTLDDGSHIHVGLEIPTTLSLDEKARVDRAIAQIAHRFTGSPYDDQSRTELDQLREQLRSVLDRNIEWVNPTTRDISRGKKIYAGVTATHVFHPKITYGDNSHEHLQTQTSAAEISFKRYKSYGGFAIHYYETFRKITDSSPSVDHQHVD